MSRMDGIAAICVEERTRTLLCSDLFTQPGSGMPFLTESDVLGPSESLRAKLDYFSHARNTGELLERLAAANPQTLACMHGSAWRGDGAALIRELAAIMAKSGAGKWKRLFSRRRRSRW